MFKSVRAGALYFLVVFGVGFVFGIVRTTLLAPRTGETLAVLIELPFILAIAWWSCRLILRGMALPPTLRSRLPMAVTAFALLMAAEAALSVVLFGRPIVSPLQLADSAAGALGFAGQVVFALFPLFMNARARKPS